MLNNIGPSGLLIILVVVLLLFGRDKIPQLMGDVAKGIRSFKRGLRDDADDDEPLPKKLDKAAPGPLDASSQEQQN